MGIVSGGGGSSQPSALGWFFYGSIAGGGAADSIAPGAFAPLSWYAGNPAFYPGRGPASLDISGANLTNPVVLTNGIYAISAEAAVSGPVVGKSLEAILYFDSDDVSDGPGASLDLGVVETHTNTAKLNIAGTRFMTAGMKVQLVAFHNAIGALSVQSWMQVQRVA